MWKSPKLKVHMKQLFFILVHFPGMVVLKMVAKEEHTRIHNAFNTDASLGAEVVWTTAHERMAENMAHVLFLSVNRLGLHQQVESTSNPGLMPSFDFS